MINVMNQPPRPLDITPSSPTVRAGADFIYLDINAEDYEDDEDELTVTVQWQYNETSPQGWSGAYITTEPYEGTPDTGRLKVKFTPDANMQLGRYDFRVKVEDTDGDESVDLEWVEISRAVEVQNPEPTLEDVALQADEVLRGEVLEIHLDATDLGDPESDLIPEIEWREQGGFWMDTNLIMYYEDTNGNLNDDVGYWVIEFTPPKNAALGEYEFRARVRNSAGGVSDGGNWETGSKWDSTYGNTADVANNEPTASNLRIIGSSTVTRGDYIFIYADGEDFEDDEDDLTPYFEYSTDGQNWDNMGLTSDRYEDTEESWRITFNPPEDETFKLGDYDFRVWFEDENGDVSNIVEESNLVKVENAPPTVTSLNIPGTKGNRMESITIIADGKDDDHGESALEPIFEYKGPNDGDWTGSDDSGTYFGSPTYFNGHWQIDFEPPAEADAGDYSFRVAFSDGIDTTTYMEKTDAYELENQAPEVEITEPDSGTQSSTTISFDIDVNDDKDTSFDYEWDFDDGGSSTDESPSHTFDPGSSYDVTVKVTDSDGDFTEEEITITIPSDGGDGDGGDGDGGDGDGDGGTGSGTTEEGDDMMMFLLLLIIIIVVVVLPASSDNHHRCGCTPCGVPTNQEKEEARGRSASCGTGHGTGTTCSRSSACGWTWSPRSRGPYRGTGSNGSSGSSCSCGCSGCSCAKSGSKGGTADQMPQVWHGIHGGKHRKTNYHRVPQLPCQGQAYLISDRGCIMSAPLLDFFYFTFN
jgi:hypothetical protein